MVLHGLIFSMDKKKRINELNDFVGKDKVIFLKNLIDEIVFMEEKLESLKKYPFVKESTKKKPMKTEASKLYLSIMAQYTQDIKVLSYLAGKTNEDDEISPLRLYIQNMSKGE